ncbi:hypothetical protein ASE36_21085 [Rhizobium sp. Root274]|uniref:PRC-barrel domain-containing protein n=1 Tax=unclassified Rhizobium TaxID=2613769 RepID=UPI0007123206|nr:MULTISPECIES: PRC-barrel domain-containing protein [unclassified Rhizobium]KQW25435.1 hypothetical protein ASC71_21145 [Rhizobium sp. Root1240]KRD26055.1 hypothetical protein ASE36_21085 [Rhizobium sp. Root274]
MPRPSLILLWAISIALPPTFAGAQGSGNSVKILPDWSYQPLFDRAASVKVLLDEATVTDSSGEVVSDIENIIFSDDGDALAIIAGIHGDDGGQIHVSIPWKSIEFGRQWTDVNVGFDFDKIDQYTGFDPSGIIEKSDLASIGTVETGGAMDLGEDVFRANDLIGDDAYLGDKRSGTVNDLVVRDGHLEAIVVEMAEANGRRHYAAPFDKGAGVNPGDRRYQPPLDENAIKSLGDFDYDRFKTARD